MKLGRSVVLALVVVMVPACKVHVVKGQALEANNQIAEAEKMAAEAARDYWSNRACRHQKRAVELANKEKSVRAHARYRHANRAVALWKELHGGKALECVKP